MSAVQFCLESSGDGWRAQVYAHGEHGFGGWDPAGPPIVIDECALPDALRQVANRLAPTPDLEELQRQVKALQRLVDHPARWNAASIIGALRLYAQEHERAPSAESWKTAAADRSTPPASTVIDTFGSWSEAMSAAGVQSNRSGRPSNPRQDA